MADELVGWGDRGRGLSVHDSVSVGEGAAELFGLWEAVGVLVAFWGVASYAPTGFDGSFLLAHEYRVAICLHFSRIGFALKI